MAQFMPKMVLFDLDGTLIDSVPDLHIAVNQLQDEIGFISNRKNNKAIERTCAIGWAMASSDWSIGH